MELRVQNLKAFKKGIKTLLREYQVNRYQIRINRDSLDYTASVQNGIIILGIPELKQIDNQVIQLGFRAISRKKHTMKIFLGKRIPPPGSPSQT